MTDIVLRFATSEDAGDITPRLRTADRREFQRLGHTDLAAAVARSIRRSQAHGRAWAGEIDGRLEAVWGVAGATLTSDVGYAWLVGADGLVTHQMAFLRRCGSCVDAMHDQFPTLRNIVDRENYAARRWLKWLGFTFEQPVRVGRHWFLPFERRR